MKILLKAKKLLLSHYSTNIIFKRGSSQRFHNFILKTRLQKNNTYIFRYTLYTRQCFFFNVRLQSYCLFTILHYLYSSRLSFYFYTYLCFFLVPDKYFLTFPVQTRHDDRQWLFFRFRIRNRRTSPHTAVYNVVYIYVYNTLYCITRVKLRHYTIHVVAWYDIVLRISNEITWISYYRFSGV